MSTFKPTSRMFKLCHMLSRFVVVVLVQEAVALVQEAVAAIRVVTLAAALEARNIFEFSLLERRSWTLVVVLMTVELPRAMILESWWRH